MKCLTFISALLLLACSDNKPLDRIEITEFPQKSSTRDIKRVLGTVKHGSHGCFTSYQSTLTISELKDGNYIATFKIKERYPFTKTISQEQFNAFKTFITDTDKLKKLTYFICTNWESVDIDFGGRMISKEYYDCTGDSPFDILLNKLSLAYTSENFIREQRIYID